MIKTPWDFWERNGKLAYQVGDVRIYNVEGEDYLFVGPVLYASSTERTWYVKNVYPRAKGKCLEIGLGLGVASKVILASKDVRHLLTIEKGEDVIAAFGKPLPRHNILERDVNEWMQEIADIQDFVEPIYDFIFVDHYTFEDEEYFSLQELQQSLKPLLKEGGKMVFWIDEMAAEEEQYLIRSLWI